MKDINSLAERYFQSNLKYTLPQLKKITKNEIKFHNFIANKSRPIPFKVDKRNLYLQLIPMPSEQNNDFAEIWIKFLVNQHFFWIGLSKYSFGVLLGNCFLFDSLKDQPVEIRSAIVESTADDLLNTIEYSTSSKIEIDTIALQNPDTNITRDVFSALDQNGDSNANSSYAFDESLFNNLKDQPVENRGAILESTVDALLNKIEHSISSRTKIDTVTLQTLDANVTRSIFFAVDQNGSSDANGYVAFDEALSPFFLNFLGNLPDTDFHKWNLLQTSIRFQIGSTQLNVEELKDLNCNDLIFIDDCPLLHDHLLTVCIDPNLVCKGTHKDNKLVIQTTMSEKMKEENSNVTDIDELQINLVFDVGEKSLQFQELKKIQPGYIFELDNLIARPVTIRANGQSIGSGELLQADEKIAVRVLKLHQKANG